MEETVTITMPLQLKEQVESLLRETGQTWSEFIISHLDDIAPPEEE